MKINSFMLFVAMMLLFASCDNKKNEYDPYKIKGGNSKKEVSKAAFEVGFKETAANLKTVHVNINGKNSYDALFDTGCSDVLISSLEVQELVKQGTLSDADLIGFSVSTIADGSSIINKVVNLKEISLVDKNGKSHTLRDISATIVENPAASILIGSSVIDNLAKKSYTVDLKKKVIRFE